MTVEGSNGAACPARHSQRRGYRDRPSPSSPSSALPPPSPPSPPPPPPPPSPPSSWPSSTPTPLPPTPRPERRILFLDAYDSFTNNVVSLLKEALGDRVAVHVVRMDLRTLDADPGADWTPRILLDRLPAFDAVVCGPGPGSPLRPADVGAFELLWRLPPGAAVPVLGICLGFQSLAAHLGASIRRLTRGLHGMVRDIDHAGADVFDALPPFRATLYHSLCADVGQDSVPDADWPAARWAAPAAAPDLVPLAWACEPTDAGPARAERILMAARHATRPLWGVQYHPESVCTDPAAHGVVRNWFRQALKWNEAVGRRVDRSIPCLDSLGPAGRSLPGLGAGEPLSAYRWWRDMQSGLARAAAAPGYASKAMKLPAGVETADVTEALGLGAGETIILDSSSTANGEPLARMSVIALDVDRALRVEYRVGDRHVTLRRADESQRICLGVDAAVDPWSPWHVLSEFWRSRRIPVDDAQPCAFKGGLMGFVTYEMGLSTLSPGLVARDRGHRRPDICMAWISKSIVLDHKAGVAYVQALTTPGSDASWIDAVAETLRGSRAWRRGGSGSSSSSSGSSVAAPPARSNEALLSHVRQGGDRLRFSIPDSDSYERDVRRCQDAIRDGESYELCLTAQTTLTRPRCSDVPSYLQLERSVAGHGNGAPGPRRGDEADAGPEEASGHGTPWDMYRALRRRQPAPFGSFLRMGGATIVSSSPERFLKHDELGLCSMRPMKGTVRKSDAVSTLAEAERILHVPKEEAENLMIVDLVRHDLHGVCGAGRVTVPDLLRVDEYAGVFQMSSVVEGRLPAGTLAGGGGGGGGSLAGTDVLAAALPPGSMTGAPKKRSCELLAALEGTERGVYSGVVGYLDAQGRGDWSVTIRTLFRWDDERTAEEEVWRIGAGGAVTTLSTPADERDEMLTKLCGPLGVLRDVA